MKKKLETKQIKTAEVIASASQTQDELEICATEELVALQSCIPNAEAEIKGNIATLLESSGINNLEAQAKLVANFKDLINRIIASRFEDDSEVLINTVQEDESTLIEHVDEETGEITQQPTVVNETKKIYKKVYTFKVKDNLTLINLHDFYIHLINSGLKCCLKFEKVSLDSLSVEETLEILDWLYNKNHSFISAFKLSNAILNNTLILYPNLITELVDAGYIDVIAELKESKAKVTQLSLFEDIPVETVDITPSIIDSNIEESEEENNA